MKTVLIVLSLATTTCCYAQRTDAGRDARVGGVREGAVERSASNEDPQLKAKLKKLSKDSKTSILRLREELQTSRNTMPGLSFDKFREIKLVSFREGLKLDDLVRATQANPEKDPVKAAKSLKELKTPPK